MRGQSADLGGFVICLGRCSRMRTVNKTGLAMLIFDTFETRQKAEQFADCVKQKYGVDAFVYDSQAESEGQNAQGIEFAEWIAKYDICPFELMAPIVLVHRPKDASKESKIEKMVRKFNGVFAGT
jgi:hypothetical protein